MKYDTEKIADAIRKAVEVAQEFATIDDGGTCNFDCAYLVVPGMREKQAEQIAELSGVYLSLTNSRWHGRILKIIGGRNGQGARQTKMAEAMQKSLDADGIHAAMYYAMD